MTITHVCEHSGAEIMKNSLGEEQAMAGHITAEQVREMSRRSNNCACMSSYCGCRPAFFGNVLSRLLTHPGVCSSARAVIEAALE